MSKTKGQQLEKLFHEPNRLLIMSELCATAEGLSFNELKNACDLTDGNLSRHLTALESNKAVQIKKSFIENKPRTTVTATASGRKKFLSYLDSLEAVLKDASKRARKLEKEQSHETVPANAKPVRS